MISISELRERFMQWLKLKVAGEEIAALNRYRLSCHTIEVWMPEAQSMIETSRWISRNGETGDAMDIEKFRRRAMTAVIGVTG